MKMLRLDPQSSIGVKPALQTLQDNSGRPLYELQATHPSEMPWINRWRSLRSTIQKQLSNHDLQGVVFLSGRSVGLCMCDVNASVQTLRFCLMLVRCTASKTRVAFA